MRKKTDQTSHTTSHTASLKRFATHVMYGLGGFVLLITLWELIGLRVFRRPGFTQFNEFLPLPAFKALSHLVSDPLFWDSVLISLTRILIGLGIAFFVGFSIGIMQGFFHRLRKLTNLPLQFIRMVSPLAWMPIAILVLPTFEHAIYFLIMMAAMWPVMHNTAQAIQDVPSSWIAMAEIHGASRRQVLTHVLLPAAAPAILNGLRLALGIAWIILVPAEYLGINKGLGFLINDARDSMEYDRLMALVIAIGVLGFLLDGLFAWIRKPFDWRQKAAN